MEKQNNNSAALSSVGETVILAASGLRKWFGAREAVKGIDFQIQAGECFGFLGPNGAGKTTTIKMILGLVEKSGGELRIFGHSLARNPREIKARIGVVPQNDNLDTDLTVEENLLVYASYYGIGRRAALARSSELLDFFALSNRSQEIIQHLSGGQRRRLLLARALIHYPEFLILDEPTVGLDPQARQLIWERLKNLREQGVTMLLTSHYMDEVARLSDRVLILDHGVIVAQGEPRQLVTELVGMDVFEINGLAAELDELEAAVAGCRVKTERFETLLLIYVEKECPELESLVRPRSHWLRRPANLEDLFIRLTGRSLRES